MNYTRIPPLITEELSRLNAEPIDLSKCEQNPSYFSKHILGITPYKYQHLILRKYADGAHDRNGRLIICKSRQIGISICLAILALWYASYNKANGGLGTGIYKNTKVGIISRSDDQAKKLMAEIQKMVWYSPDLTFRAKALRERGKPLNKKELHFQNGWVKCFPPTDSCRGESFDLLIVDEAAFVDDNLFKDAMEPTVSKTNGKIILSSTPNGQKGLFFELYDPYNLRWGHEYERLWFYYKMCEDPVQMRIIEDKLKHAKETGNLKSFDQEYNALFTVDECSFFENGDVERGMDKNLTILYEYKDGPCSLGVDYGAGKSETALTVITFKDNKAILLFQFSQTNLDENLLMDTNWEHSIPNLNKRYRLNNVVVDDCLDGDTEIVLVQDGTYIPKTIKDCKIGDVVLSYDFEKKEYCHKPIENHVWKGMLEAYRLSFRNGTSVITSKNHEWFCAQERIKRGKLRKHNVRSTELLRVNHGGYGDKLVSVKEIPYLFKNKPDTTKELFYLLGMYIAEGHYHVGENRFYISQILEKRKPRIRQSLQKVGFRFSEIKKGFCILEHPPQIFLECGLSSYEKRIPKILFSYPKEYLTFLLEGLIEGDGYYIKDRIDKRGYPRSGGFGYSTVSKELANDFRFLCLLLGKPTRFNHRVHSGFNSDKVQYEPTYCKTSNFNNEYYPNTSLTSISEIKHIGYVQMWDIKVKDTQSFVLWESGIITHNCPMGNRTNKQLENEGYPVMRFCFTSDQFMGERNRGYYMFRSYLKKGKIKYPELRRLMGQMKAIQEVKTERNNCIRIKAPVNRKEDMVDSFMMACFPFFSDEDSFSSETVDYSKVKVEDSFRKNNGRFDSDWERIRLRG